jgi:hypothetical protein
MLKWLLTEGGNVVGAVEVEDGRSVAYGTGGQVLFDVPQGGELFAARDLGLALVSLAYFADTGQF